ncbi:unnamed protein product [Rotaria sordida]|uniref:Mab-21-like HhH/H2TH-like domain-containing protein n=1 Tax=Rotaria sordida TaxID=392033 RepID=A0A815FM27_9BILA|nr:unnamed protein product [Rotaria sordida]CAF3917621.1 unnamed protein product [Rotaria sordida]
MDESFITGSTVEGDSVMRRLNYENKTELDIMFIRGLICNENQLIPVDNAFGFTKILWNNEHFKDLPCFFDKHSGNNYVDGFTLKQNTLEQFKHCITTIGFGALIENLLTSVNDASVQMRLNFDALPRQSSRDEMLSIIEELKNLCLNNNLIIKQHRTKYDSCDQILEQNSFENITTNESRCNFKLQMVLNGPIIGIPLDKKIQQQLFELKIFLQKYQHYILKTNVKTSKVEQIIPHGTYDMDLVLSLRLNFIPKILDDFFNRIKLNQFDLYEQIRTMSIYLIPKPSSIYDDFDQCRVQFRYSFSEIEKKLAQLRKPSEQLLNRIARSIYYDLISKAHLMIDKKYIPSYFVKTTILWLCENTNNLDHLDQNQLTKLWIDYALSCFKTGYCLHYFLTNVNILNNFPEKLLTLAYDKLKNWTLAIRTDDKTVNSEHNLPQFEQWINTMLFRIPSDEEKQFNKDLTELIYKHFYNRQHQHELTFQAQRFFSTHDLLNLFRTGCIDIDAFVEWCNYLIYFENPNQLPLSLQIDEHYTLSTFIESVQRSFELFPLNAKRICLQSKMNNFNTEEFKENSYSQYLLDIYKQSHDAKLEIDQEIEIVQQAENFYHLTGINTFADIRNQLLYRQNNDITKKITDTIYRQHPLFIEKVFHNICSNEIIEKLCTHEISLEEMNEMIDDIMSNSIKYAIEQGRNRTQLSLMKKIMLQNNNEHLMKIPFLVYVQLKMKKTLKEIKRLTFDDVLFNQINTIATDYLKKYSMNESERINLFEKFYSCDIHDKECFKQLIIFVISNDDYDRNTIGYEEKEMILDIVDYHRKKNSQILNYINDLLQNDKNDDEKVLAYIIAYYISYMKKYRLNDNDLFLLLDQFITHITQQPKFLRRLNEHVYIQQLINEYKVSESDLTMLFHIQTFLHDYDHNGDDEDFNFIYFLQKTYALDVQASQLWLTIVRLFHLVLSPDIKQQQRIINIIQSYFNENNQRRYEKVETLLNAIVK